jgi:hypothetical protein
MWNKRRLKMSKSEITRTVIAVVQAVEVLQERTILLREIKLEAIEAGRLKPIWSQLHFKTMMLPLKLFRGMSWNKQANYQSRRFTVRNRARRLADEMGYNPDDVTELLMSLMSPYM